VVDQRLVQQVATGLSSAALSRVPDDTKAARGAAILARLDERRVAAGSAVWAKS